MERDDKKRQTIEHTNRVSCSLFVLGFIFSCAPTADQSNDPLTLYPGLRRKMYQKLKQKE